MIRMVVLVCGGRDWIDLDRTYYALDLLRFRVEIIKLIHGGARGADTLAGDWAKTREIHVETYPANWSLHGRRAGYLRNQQMLDKGTPDLAVAFPGGRGTADMVRRCQREGINVWQPNLSRL